MSIFEAIVLGIVQGLTEFLPISSSGHLVLVPEFAGWDQPSLPFFVLLHAATLLALVVYFRRELIETAFGMVRSGPQRRFVWLLALATLPAAVIGVVFEEWFEQVFGNPYQVAIQLIGTGVILIGAEALTRRKDASDRKEVLTGVKGLTEQVSWRAALGVGLAQAAAILPGISRSGSTISAAMLAGLSRAQAARFSFLMAIPILIGTAVFQVPQLSGDSVGAGALAAGFVSAGISSYLSIAGMVAFLQRRGLIGFAVYCIAAGGIAATVLGLT
ncbi:MAG: undecaprenyl-diphosphate phosphatase [Actinomycetota bacterium]